jgi:hypothetical protein
MSFFTSAIALLVSGFLRKVRQWQLEQLFPEQVLQLDLAPVPGEPELWWAKVLKSLATRPLPHFGQLNAWSLDRTSSSKPPPQSVHRYSNTGT